MRPGYAIEYDYVIKRPDSLFLRKPQISGLFFAGQINGTTGYEEAAGQGIIAGINAVQKLRKKDPVILKRSESYIGVMIDDLVTKGVDEPYRMFTSRAEHRLLLRHDNADLRLRRLGYQLGLISEEQYARLLQKEEAIRSSLETLPTTFRTYEGKTGSLAQILARPEVKYEDLISLYDIQNFGHETNVQIERHIKYAGYIKRQESDVQKLSLVENIKVPLECDFHKITGLRTEAKLRLSKVRPQNLGQASRIPGITPADISVLQIAFSRKFSHDCC